MQHPEQKSCPECGGSRVTVNYLGLGQIMLYQPKHLKKSAKDKQTSATRAIVCTVCGFVTIYAILPQNLTLND